MIRVLVSELPNLIPPQCIATNTVLVNEVDTPALYFENGDIEIARSLGGEMLVTQ